MPVRAQMIHVCMGDATGVRMIMRIKRQAAAGDADAFVVGKHSGIVLIFSRNLQQIETTQLIKQRAKGKQQKEKPAVVDFFFFLFVVCFISVGLFLSAGKILVFVMILF